MNRRHAFIQLILVRLREFCREPQAIFWVYGFPIILAVVLGMAFANAESPPPVVDVQGQDDQTDVRELVRVLKAHDFKVRVCPESECKQRLRTGETSLYLIPGTKGPTYVFDPTRAEGVLARRWVDDVLAREWLGEKAPPVSEIKTAEKGNRYIDFLLPGLMGLNIMGGGMWGVGFLIVDMRVKKLFKRFLATPMNRADFLWAILTARMVFIFPEMLTLLLVGWLGFGVPIYGSPLTLTLVILMGALAFDGIGLLIACRVEKLETVSGLMNLVMLPMWLASGTFFSARRFPDFLQPLIQALPLTPLNDALRAVMLEGAGVVDVGRQLAILGGWTVISFVLALRWFKWR
jgi:ABC-type multidrug transport system permease subunit